MKTALSAWLLICTLCVTMAAAPPKNSGAAMALVVNANTPVADLSLSDVRELFRGKKQFWSDGASVVLLVQRPDTLEHEVLLRVVYRMSETEYRQYWISEIFRAEAISAPKTVDSNQTALKIVEEIPGAIVLMDAHDVSPRVKVLRVDKRLPGEAGYPLK